LTIFTLKIYLILLKKNITTFILLIFTCQFLVAQCAMPVTDAGLYCDIMAPEDAAPVICDLDCLDGFSATMPDTIYGVQPEQLCSSGGTPNNLSWFAFVAGSTTVDITITPSNCTESFNDDGTPTLNSKGIQAGIYKDCVFDNENNIACFNDCSGNNEDPVNLSSTEFVEGQIYYLFVDGCGGSICDYVVTVNDGEQAFEMPELTTISNEFNLDLETETVCQGAEIAFILDDFDLDVNFSWRIEPSTTEYPIGLHPSQDTNIVDFVFSDVGEFEIIVYAFNECDETEPDTVKVIVEALEDEYFTDVMLCQECIIEGIMLVSPDDGCIMPDGVPLILTEDPNGDDLPGWQGTTVVTSAGLDSNLVTNSFGCTYYQYVNIVEIPLPAREQVEYYFCLEDFPVTIDGLTYNSPGNSKNITIENGAVSGCDSLLMITASAIDLIASSSIGDCDNGIVTLGLDIIQATPADYDSIVYIWKDENGDLVVDGDDDDMTLLVSTQGTYSVMATVYTDGASCTQTYGSLVVDPENLSPIIPDIAFAPLAICQSEETAIVYVNSQGLGEGYTWDLVPPLPFVEGQTSDTIYIDVSNADDVEFCVIASNGCGTSEMFCDDIIVSSAPVAFFTIVDELCVDSTLSVVYSGPNGQLSSSEFSWDFDGGVVENGADLQGGGPFQVKFPSSGVYDISLLLTEAGCTSSPFSEQIMVSDPYSPPVVNCESFNGEVLFTFDDASVTSVVVDVLSGQPFEMISMDSIVVNNLMPEEEVQIEFLFNSEDICDGAIVEDGCVSLPCPNVEFNISLGNQNQCIDEEDRNIELAIEIINGDGGAGAWNSPFVYEGNLFNVLMAGAGEHNVVYNYDIDGCFYNIDTTIVLIASPTLQIDVFPTLCEEEGITSVDIETNADMLLVDGVITTEFENIQVLEDSMLIQGFNDEGCKIEEWVLNSLVVDPSVNIMGDSVIVEGISYSYDADFSGLDDVLSYVWTFEGDTICNDCNSVNLVDIEEGILCVSAYYSEICFVENCLPISTIEENEIHIPNAFSPNNDSMNDEFVIQSNNQLLPLESIIIMDRWGTLVVDEKMISHETFLWDGTFQGSLCQPGVYVYVIKYKNLEGRVLTKMGDITLVR